MDINSWLTVISIFIAIIAFLPKEELWLIRAKLYTIEYLSILIILLILIPYLIYFPSFAGRTPFLKYFTIKNGFKPSNIAFALFYLTSAWVVFRIFWLQPKSKITKPIIDYFIKLMFELPFPKFYSLFTKYTPVQISAADWVEYNPIILQPTFLKGIIQYQPGYLYNIWQRLEDEQQFRTVVGIYFFDTHSPFYTEIKANYNSRTILANSPFLNKIAVENLQQSIGCGILLLISDVVKSHLLSQGGNSTSIYNQEKIYNHFTEEDGYDLHVNYYIQFIGLLYSTAIENKKDIHTIAHGYGNMQTIYSNMIESMVSNIKHDENRVNFEYPSNYHWLIGEIFKITSDWLDAFGGKHHISSSDSNYAYGETAYTLFSATSSYVEFIPFCQSLCLNELYKGYENGKISAKFICSMMHYYVLSYYFDNNAKVEILEQIEKEIIAEIPDQLLEPILTFTLDERFAIRFDSFLEKRFFGAHRGEIQILKRLLAFITKESSL